MGTSAGAVIRALVVAGHSVTGLVRGGGGAEQTEQKRKAAQAAGASFVRVVDSFDDIQAVKSLVSQFQACIHTASGTGASDVGLTRAMLVAMQGPVLLQQGKCFSRTFLYCGGNFVCGTVDFTNEDAAPSSPFPGSEWRSDVEDLVLGSDTGAEGVIISESSNNFVLRTAVIRPGFVYGGDGVGDFLVKPFLKTALAAGAAEVLGNGTNVLPIVHVDDVALLFLRVLECENGEADEHRNRGVFHAVQPPLYLEDPLHPTQKATHTPASSVSLSTVNDLAEICSAAAGAGGKISHKLIPEAVKEMGAFAYAFEMDQRLGCSRSLAIGWNPRTGLDARALMAEFGMQEGSGKSRL